MLLQKIIPLAAGLARAEQVTLSPEIIQAAPAAGAMP